MKKYNNPGIFFEETIASADGASTVVRKPADFSPKNITSAEMGIGAFVGIAPRGAMREPILVTNWTEYVNEFGGFDVNSMLAYAVQGFFQNGGSKAYIVRTCKYNSDTCSAKIATLDVKDSSEGSSFVLNAKNEGTWGNQIGVEIKEAGENNFTLNIYLKNVLAESYKTTLADLDTDLSESKLVSLVSVGSQLPKANSITSLAGGLDGISDMQDSDYVNAIEVLMDEDFNNLAVPGITTVAVHKAMDDFMDRKGFGQAFKDAPQSMSDSQLVTYRASLGNSARGRMINKYVKVTDPIGVGKNPVKNVPSCGHVMGVVAFMQRNNGAWIATAGVDAKIKGILGLSSKVTETSIALLNPVGITCLKEIKNVGVVIWGARTFSDNKELKYANIRDLIDYIELSLKQSMGWTNFKNNDNRLWGMIKPNVETFLRGVWAQGGLKGDKPEEAYWVKCDAEINTPDVVDEGITYCDIGIAGSKPNEFTVFRMNVRG